MYDARIPLDKVSLVSVYGLAERWRFTVSDLYDNYVRMCCASGYTTCIPHQHHLIMMCMRCRYCCGRNAGRTVLPVA